MRFQWMRVNSNLTPFGFIWAFESRRTAHPGKDSHPKGEIAMFRMPIRTTVALAAALVLVAGCNAQDSDSATATAGNDTDPAIAGALQDQIMVDPNLDQKSNSGAVRPAGAPYSGGIPPEDIAADGSNIDGGLRHAPAPVADGNCTQCQASRDSVTLGGLARRQGNGRTAQCAPITYSARWARRLPRDIPLYPRARVIEAAGADGGPCNIRVVTFYSPDSMQHMLDWYYTVATRAGYDAEHQLNGDEHVLGGTRARDEGAYVLFLRAGENGGTEIDLVTNNGR